MSLYTAASSSERIAFNTLKRKTGNRVKREYVDSETGDPVERDDQVKGYVPDSDKTLKIDAFIPCNEIDGVYFDKPYYLAPAKMGTEAFVLLRDRMKMAKVAAIARTVPFRRVRTDRGRDAGACRANHRQKKGRFEASSFDDPYPSPSW